MGRETREALYRIEEVEAFKGLRIVEHCEASRNRNRKGFSAKF